MFVKDFVHLTNTLACPNMLVGHSFVSLYHEPHGTDDVFGRRSRRTSRTQIVRNHVQVCTWFHVQTCTRRGVSALRKGEPLSNEDTCHVVHVRKGYG
ncbi:hypothetical protein EVAR_33868_1 [Eumeta japonica]|uniref:Uncharacterized protein n=1 Tax=Eumeta variegata TaxID=151549 RepID=A0A4C1X456_EUMVA|nr:hypothetical protein EVAR_33868_1 [Eumeta japonica]